MQQPVGIGHSMARSEGASRSHHFLLELQSRVDASTGSDGGQGNAPSWPSPVPSLRKRWGKGKHEVHRDKCSQNDPKGESKTTVPIR